MSREIERADDLITVFKCKKIITMDPGLPDASAVAVRGGKILSVGSVEDIEPWLNRAAHTVDTTFADKVVLPGFIEPHGHPIVGGTALTRPLLTFHPSPNPYGPDFPGVTNREQAISKLREYAAQSKPDSPLIAWGYDLTAMGGQHLDRHVLDDVSATQPILVWEASEHFVYANSAALSKYPLTKDDLNVTGVLTDADGQPTGQFLGTLAAELMMRKPLVELMQPSVLHYSIRYLMDLSRKHGITTTSEMAMGLIDCDLELAALSEHFDNDNSPLRLVVVTDGANAVERKGQAAIDFVKSLQEQSRDRMVFRGVKFFADDAFLSLGMAIENPGYIDGRKGLFITRPEEMVGQWLPWWQAGFHIHVHTNGNAGNEATVNALDDLMKVFPRADHRFTFEHFGISTPEQARRIKALGGVVSINPYYLYHRSELTAPYIGADRAYTAARLKTLTDLGVVVSLHTDTPVAPPCPLEEVWIAVNRFGLSGAVRGPAERVSVNEALKMVTINAAYTLGVENKIGSIAAGKFADFVVLEEDPVEVRPEKIRDIKVWGTVSGGKVFPATEIGKRPPTSVN
ncbi:MAG TPA: amidohydrolase [Candidatus Obscuribacterales bacterium]